VLEYDTNLIEIASDQSQSAALSFEGTVLDGTDSHGRVTVHPSAGVVTIALVTSLIAEGFEIPAREEVLLAWLHAKVSPEALPGTVISLAPPSGEGEAGVGPYHLRNELSYRGGGRFISIRPRLDEAYVSIVGDQSFFRGDSNGDTRVDISDSIHILGWLFLGGEDPDCEDAADSNDDGELNVTDAIFALNFLFNSGATIPPPYLEEGRDPTDDDPLHCYRLRSSEN
jgi:hypothetical protein